jgi:hypothetical protein
MNASKAFEKIRPVVEAMADLMCCHGFSPEEEGLIRSHLLARGFELELIRQAEDWCEKSQSSGSIVDLLSMFVPSAIGTRVSNPLERIAVSDQMLSAIEQCRDRGIISVDMAERLLEGSRALDTRDWDDDDVRAFFVDACAQNISPEAQTKLERALTGNFKDYYC